MGYKRKLVTLGDVAEINPPRSLKRGQNAIHVGMAQISPWVKNIPVRGVRKYKGSGSRFMNGDTLLARITPCLENGKTAYVSFLEEGEVGHGSTEFIVLSGKEGYTDNLFVYYLSISHEFRQYAIVRMEGTSGRQRVPAQTLHKLKFFCPPLEEQKIIVYILKTLDDKIELNRQMNNTLESMARAIFKSWFVDFDPVYAKMEGKTPVGMNANTASLFPDSFEDSALGKIPKGWKVESIENLADRVAMGPFGSSIKVSTFVSDGIPVISGQHLKHTLLEDNHYNFITLSHAEKLKNSNAFRGDVVFTHAGNIGQVAYIPETSRYERYVISQRQFYMRCNVERTSPLFVVYFFKTSEGQHRLLANTSSTGVPSISRPVSYLKTIKITVPTKPLTEVFDKLIRSLHLQISNNITQSKTLATIRDTLLPKLLSGELRIKDTENFVETVL